MGHDPAARRPAGPAGIAPAGSPPGPLPGRGPGRDIEVTLTGLGPGEKLYEELFHGAEELVATSPPTIMLSGSREMDWDEMQQMLEVLRRVCVSRDIPRLHQGLQQLVPEFTPDIGR